MLTLRTASIAVCTYYGPLFAFWAGYDLLMRARTWVRLLAYVCINDSKVGHAASGNCLMRWLGEMKPGAVALCLGMRGGLARLWVFWGLLRALGVALVCSLCRCQRW